MKEKQEALALADIKLHLQAEMIETQYLRLSDLWTEAINRTLTHLTSELAVGSVEAGGKHIRPAWVGTAIVAAVNESGNLVGLATNHEGISMDAYQIYGPEKSFWQLHRPAVAKAMVIRELDRHNLKGGIAANYDDLTTLCGFPYHAGEAIVQTQEGKIYLGVTTAQPSLEHLAAEFGIELNAPVIALLHSHPDFDYLQAGYFDSKFAHLVAQSLGEPLTPPPTLSVEIWSGNS